jgi:hypothetical protein
MFIYQSNAKSLIIQKIMSLFKENKREERERDLNHY